MRKTMKIIGGVLLLIIAGLATAWFGFLKPEPPPISPEDRAQITLMPLPSEMKLKKSVFVLSEDLTHAFSGLSTPRMERAVERFYGRLSSQTGLESLLQLVREQEDQWIVPGLTLKDNPRFGWRGLMIDVCRHWIPKEVILRNLDAMAAVKMNLLHLHLTEYQGFRVESKVFPGLHEMGSGGDYYTQEDIRQVVEYAADRGIRVVPEFDLPGHTTSWFAGYPELASAPGPYSPDTVFMVLDPVLDPTREGVYEFLDRFFGEMAGLFPDDYIHIGGDEVNPLYWNENPAIREFMKENGLEDPHALQAYFNIRLHKILKKQPASYHYNVDPTVIAGAVTIEVDSTNWKGWDCTMNVSDMIIDGSLFLFGEGAGLRGIMEFMGGSAGFTDVVVDGDHVLFAIESNFGQVKYDLKISGDSIAGSAKLAFITIQLNGKRSGGTDMEGGEACMWSEMVDSVTLESRVWPRAAAVAEKLWSPKVLTGGSQDMYRRIMVMDDLLESLGVRHRDYREGMLAEMVGETVGEMSGKMFVDPYLPPLRLLVELLQEDKFFNRMTIYDPELYTTTPLNRIVDAALPESYVAYRFSQDVDLLKSWWKTQRRIRYL